MKIKPCPFCGSTKTSLTVYGNAESIHCLRCGGEGPLGMMEKNYKDAIRLWNERIK